MLWNLLILTNENPCVIMIKNNTICPTPLLTIPFILKTGLLPHIRFLIAVTENTIKLYYLQGILMCTNPLFTNPTFQNWTNPVVHQSVVPELNHPCCSPTCGSRIEPALLFNNPRFQNWTIPVVHQSQVSELNHLCCSPIPGSSQFCFSPVSGSRIEPTMLSTNLRFQNWTNPVVHQSQVPELNHPCCSPIPGSRIEPTLLFTNPRIQNEPTLLFTNLRFQNWTNPDVHQSQVPELNQPCCSPISGSRTEPSLLFTNPRFQNWTNTVVHQSQDPEWTNPVVHQSQVPELNQPCCSPISGSRIKLCCSLILGSSGEPPPPQQSTPRHLGLVWLGYVMLCPVRLTIRQHYLQETWSSHELEQQQPSGTSHSASALVFCISLLAVESPTWKPWGLTAHRSYHASWGLV